MNSQIVKIQTGEIVKTNKGLEDAELLKKYPEMRYLFNINRKEFLKRSADWFSPVSLK